MVLKITPLNTVQKIPTIPITQRSVLSPLTFYTCPTGKKAIVEGKAVCTGLGAAASVRLNAGGIRIVEWTAAGGSDVVIAINRYFNFKVQLIAGQTLDYSQDVGTNGEINVLAQIQETPI